MASTHSEIKTSVVVASDDHTHITTTTKEHAETKNVVVSSDDSCVGKEEDVDKKDAGITKGVVASDDSVNEEDEDEKETGKDLGLSMDKLTLGPKKKLLVLPIGGFLVHRAHRRRPATIPKRRQPDFSSGNFMIYKRPFVEGFLKFCFERFEVGIWSSAMEHNIGGVLTCLMGELKSKLLFTWDQNECTETDFMCLDNKYKPIFLKELDQIWKKKWSEGEYSASNTLLIADPVKALLNPPNTGIFPKEYDPKNNHDSFLGPNSELRMFLDGLVEAKDVQDYVKDNRIGDRDITSSHVDWDFYSKIVRAHGNNN